MLAARINCVKSSVNILLVNRVINRLKQLTTCVDLISRLFCFCFGNEYVSHGDELKFINRPE